jgi:putative ABC transport system substrate-binding protein
MGTYRGAALGYGVSYQHWGYESGLKVIDLLKGRDVPEAGKMESLEKMTLLINKDAANKQGLVIPDSLLKKADNVF